ncbi:2-phosphosulfolactate phosphatase [Thalassobacillus sp. C254]|uniref:2-phosphosulfolactate phosphatase n=1 Tax=Thalassobacillus sp. C254 TaxID=1225341 RepID=UPI0006CF52C1|nr:2-phosphosulfolactate phosphatase [Thalassobacillus sp. C254]
MRKIHVIPQKEAVREEKLTNCTAVVIDVFLATSTIAFLMNKGYDTVFAVKDASSALKVKQQQGDCLLLGETKGRPIEGFHYPDPVLIQPSTRTKKAVICSTNGTIAIGKAGQAGTILTSSIVNGHLVAEYLLNKTVHSSIVIICSGNAGRFSLEDFIGAGHIIDHLTRTKEFHLSDGAKLAKESFQTAKATSFSGLYSCETAELLNSFGYKKSVDLVINHFESVPVLPILAGDKIINLDNKEVST